MEGLLLLLVLAIIIVPIIIISMLSGIRGAITEVQHEQREMRRQVDRILSGQAAMGSPNLKEISAGELEEKQDSRVKESRKENPPSDYVRPKPEIVAAKPAVVPVAAMGRNAGSEAEIPAPPERTPSKFQETVDEILAKIWNWFLVGEEHRSKNVTAEYAIASVWLLRVGIIAVVTGIGFFLKLSIQRGWIGEEMRTAMTFVAGAGMIAAGLKMVGKKYHVLAQGFLGGGIAVLYFSAYAAAVLYGLIPDWVGFVLMALVTLSAGIIAVKTDSMTVAVLGIVGGYVSPFFLNQGAVALPILYSYLLILSLGVLGLAQRRQWRFLHYLAFVLTYAAFFYSMVGYDPGEDFGLTITFLSLFFAVHSTVVYVYHLSKGRETTTLDIFHLIANAGIYSATAYHLIREAVGNPYPAIMSLGLAIYCVAHVAVFIRRKIVDRKLMVTLIGLAGAFSVWTLPIVFDGASLTVGFSLLALLLVWLGQRMASNVVTNIGEIVYGIVFVRLLAFDLPTEFGVANASLSEYWSALAGRAWTFGISIGSIAAAAFLQRRPIGKAEGLAPAEGNDVPPIAPAGIAATALYWITLAFGFAILHLEFGAFFQHFDIFRLPVLTVLWCLLGGYLLWKARGCGGGASEAFVKVMAAVLAIALGKFFFLDMMSWSPSGFVYGGGYPNIHLFARLLDFGVILGSLWMVWRWVPKVESTPGLRDVAGFAAIAILFLYLNLELKSFLHWNLPGFEAGGISILWALFAIALVVPGILKSARGLRIAGLSLFGCTVIKVFLSDLSDMDIVFRVVAAIVVGIVLLLGSFAYIHSSARFNKEQPPDPE